MRSIIRQAVERLRWHDQGPHDVAIDEVLNLPELQDPPEPLCRGTIATRGRTGPRVPCDRRPRPGSEWCGIHDPTTTAKRIANRRKL